MARRWSNGAPMLSVRDVMMKRGTKRIGLAVLALFILWALSAADLPATFLALRDPPERTDVAMVFGGDPRYERTGHAARLFQAGLVSALLVCGGEPGPGDSARSLRDRAVELGVPRDRIFLEERSRSTRESVVYAREILEGKSVQSITLVTSPYHQRRAFLAARRSLGDAFRLVNSPASPSFWRPEGWWKHRRDIFIVASEYGKLAYYGLRGWL